MADAEEITAATPQDRKHKRPHARRSAKQRDKDTERARLHREKKEVTHGEVGDNEDNDAKDLSEADNADVVPAEQGIPMTAPAPIAPLVEQGAAIEQDAGNENDLSRLKRQLDALNAQKEGWYEDLRVAREERDEQRNETSALQRQIGIMQRTLHELTGERETSRKSKEDNDQRIKKLEKDFTEQKKRAEIAHNVADAKAVTIQELKDELEKRDIELDRAKKDRDDHRGMLEAMHAEADQRELDLADTAEAAAGKAELEEKLMMINERLEETLTEMAKDLPIEEKLAYLQEQRFTKLHRDESQASLNHHRRSNSRMVSLGSIQDELDNADDTLSEHDTEFEKEPQPLALSSIITQATDPVPFAHELEQASQKRKDSIHSPQEATIKLERDIPETKQTVKEVIVYRDMPEPMTSSKSSPVRWFKILNVLLFLILLSLSYSAAVARKEWRDVNDTRPAYIRLVDGEGIWDVLALGMGGVLVGSP